MQKRIASSVFSTVSSCSCLTKEAVMLGIQAAPMAAAIATGRFSNVRNFPENTPHHRAICSACACAFIICLKIPCSMTILMLNSTEAAKNGSIVSIILRNNISFGILFICSLRIFFRQIRIKPLYKIYKNISEKAAPTVVPTAAPAAP